MPTPPQFQGDKGINIIQGYGPGRFRIGQDVYEHALLISASHLSRWDMAALEEVSEKNLAALLYHEPTLEIVLMGTGKNIAYVPDDIRNLFRVRGIGFDVMDTGAACRTYHVLLAEKRRVGVALLPIL